MPRRIVGGSGGITRTNRKADGTFQTGATSGIVALENVNNNYTGDTTIVDGILQFRISDVDGVKNSLGSSTNTILFGTDTSSTVANTTAELPLVANSDAANYTFSRPLDYGLSTAGGRALTFRFAGDGAGGANTNKLTISGAITTLPRLRFVSWKPAAPSSPASNASAAARRPSLPVSTAG